MKLFRIWLTNLRKWSIRVDVKLCSPEIIFGFTSTRKKFFFLYHFWRLVIKILENFKDKKILTKRSDAFSGYQEGFHFPDQFQSSPLLSGIELLPEVTTDRFGRHIIPYPRLGWTEGSGWGHLRWIELNNWNWKLYDLSKITCFKKYQIDIIYE